MIISPIVGYGYWAILDVVKMYSGGHMSVSLPISTELLCVLFVVAAVLYLIIVIFIDYQIHKISKEMWYDKDQDYV